MTERVLGRRYELGQLIGEGGFADVYRARDARSDATVAVKILHPHIARNASVVRRFASEARLAQRLSEPHIVQVLDAGEDAGTYYIVMEYVEGQTLAALLRQRERLAAGEAAALLFQVLHALEVAHAAGIVHRDIKPQNLMLTRAGLLKVMDFGIAKDLTTGTQTKTDMYLGTAQYTSPEQAQGKRVDLRADLYAAGITLFELLVGHPPFEDEMPWKVLQDQVSTPPPPIRRLQPDVPEELAAVVERALQKSPTDRFASAREMQEALSPFVQSPGIGIADRPALRLPGPWVWNQRWVPPMVAALATVLLIGGLMLSVLSHAPGPPPTTPPTPTVPSSLGSEIAEGGRIPAAIPIPKPDPCVEGVDEQTESATPDCIGASPVGSAGNSVDTVVVSMPLAEPTTRPTRTPAIPTQITSPTQIAFLPSPTDAPGPPALPPSTRAPARQPASATPAPLPPTQAPAPPPPSPTSAPPPPAPPPPPPPPPPPTQAPQPTVPPPNQSPTCSMDGPTSLQVNGRGTFTGSNSFDSDGYIASWFWSATGGSPTNGRESAFSWSTASPGQYTISLQVRDDRGANSQICSRAVFVAAPDPPTAPPQPTLPPPPPPPPPPTAPLPPTVAPSPPIPSDCFAIPPRQTQMDQLEPCPGRPNLYRYKT